MASEAEAEVLYVGGKFPPLAWEQLQTPIKRGIQNGNSAKELSGVCDQVLGAHLCVVVKVPFDRSHVHGVHAWGAEGKSVILRDSSTTTAVLVYFKDAPKTPATFQVDPAPDACAEPASDWRLVWEGKGLRQGGLMRAEWVAVAAAATRLVTCDARAVSDICDVTLGGHPCFVVNAVINAHHVHGVDAYGAEGRSAICIHSGLQRVLWIMFKFLPPEPAASTASAWVSGATSPSSAVADYISRVTDVEETPQWLPPVEGVMSQPMVPIQDAVSPLVGHLPGVTEAALYSKDFAEHLQSKSGPDPHDLTIDEVAAIYLYTMNCVYGALNSALRAQDRDFLKPYFLYLRLLLAALTKLPDHVGVIFRGVASDLSSVYKKDDELYLWAFSSCTVDGDVLTQSSFMGDTGPRSLFSIDQVCGKDIARYSAYKVEKEVLVLPGLKWKIMNTMVVPGSDGLTLYVMKQISSSSVIS